MKSKRLVFIKHGNVINMYKQMYLKKFSQVFDGVEPYLKQIINFFINKKGYYISILSLGNSHSQYSPEKNIELKVIKNNSQIKILKILEFIINNFILLKYLIKRNPIKIINLGDLNYLPILIIYSFLSGAEIILFLTGSIEGHSFQNKLIKLVEKRFSKIISLNIRNIDILQNLGYSGEWDLCKPNYKEIPNSQINPTNLRNDKKFKVLFIGRLAFVKGIDILQETVLKARKKDISFYVIGDGPYCEKLKLLKQENNLYNLHLLGYIPNKEIYSYINDSDVGFIPSKSEGVCKTLLEFMLMETPVIASNVGGIPEIVINGVNGFLVDPYDANGFLNKIEQLKNDKDLLLALSNGTLTAKKEILNFNTNFSYFLKKIIK